MAERQEEILTRTSQALAQLGQIQQVSNITATEAVTFDFLKSHAIMLLARDFGLNWDNHVSKLFHPLDYINTEVMDEDEVDILLTKG